MIIDDRSCLVHLKVAKVDEERLSVENRFQGQISGLRDDISKHLDEIGKLSSESEHLKRLNADVGRRLHDREQLADQFRYKIQFMPYIQIP